MATLVGAHLLVVGVPMTPLDVMLLFVVGLVIYVLVTVADQIDGTNDDNGYNNETGLKDDDA